MKPFDNVVVSATEPRSKVWIKHKYVKYNGTWQNITYGENGEVQSNSKRLTTDKIKLEKGNYKLDNLNNPEISPVAIARFNDESFVEVKANIKFPYELVVDDTFNQISLVFKKINDGVITSGDVKNFEILSYENDILVKDDGVYNSVINKKEDYIPVFDTTYITGSTGTIKFCSVINKVAYISLELSLKAVSLSNQQVKLVTGLPKAIANFNDIGYLFRNNALYKTLRFRINPGGELISWYNSAIELQVNDTILLNISYLVQ